MLFSRKLFSSHQVQKNINIMRYKEIERWMMTNLSSQKVTNHITSLSLKASRNNRKSGYSLPHRSPSIVLWMAWLNFNNAMKLNYTWIPPFSTSTCRMWRWWFRISRRQASKQGLKKFFINNGTSALFITEPYATYSSYIQIIIKVFSLIKYFLSNKNLTSPILTLDAN